MQSPPPHVHSHPSNSTLYVPGMLPLAKTHHSVKVVARERHMTLLNMEGHLYSIEIRLYIKTLYELLSLFYTLSSLKLEM